MTQEEKSILLKDLCARLPYKVKVRGVFLNYNKDKDKILYEECDRELDYTDLNRYESLKPYLRPMSSMTEEEREYYDGIRRYLVRDDWEVVDWLNANHFDYRGLIEKGLALEAPEEMYNIKTE